MNTKFNKTRILITCTDVMMIQFIVPHVLYLDSMGAIVDVACSSAEGYQKEGYLEKIKSQLPARSSYYHVRTERNPFSIQNLSGYSDLKRIIDNNNYDLVWTNEPVMGVMTRLASRRYRKKGGKVMYLVHGYHFFKGAPKKNWMYYPVERFFSTWCDAITVINWEDFDFTKKHFSTPVYHIDGIGLSLEKYKNTHSNFEEKRKSLGINNEDILIVSVGELQSRKNHQIMIKAIGEINDPSIKYIICGRGELLSDLQELSVQKGVAKQVQFLGHRYDIAEILSVADIFAHPSQREGLGIAAIEAMAAGLPLITSNVQGIKDYVENGYNGFSYNPYDLDGFVEGLKRLINNKSMREEMGKRNQACAEKYSIEKSKVAVAEIIKKILRA